jgi:hypothetical protein
MMQAILVLIPSIYIITWQRFREVDEGHWTDAERNTGFSAIPCYQGHELLYGLMILHGPGNPGQWISL